MNLEFALIPFSCKLHRANPQFRQHYLLPSSISHTIWVSYLPSTYHNPDLFPPPTWLCHPHTKIMLILYSGNQVGVMCLWWYYHSNLNYLLSRRPFSQMMYMLTGSVENMPCAAIHQEKSVALPVSSVKPFALPRLVWIFLQYLAIFNGIIMRTVKLVKDVFQDIVRYVGASWHVEMATLTFSLSVAWSCL